jgi:hypothetical protein
LLLHGFLSRSEFCSAATSRANAVQVNYVDVGAPKPILLQVDAEILGAGVVMAFTVITPLILLAYAVEGRKAVQSTSIDSMFSFVAAITLIAAGGTFYSICTPCVVTKKNRFGQVSAASRGTTRTRTTTT